MVLTCLENYSTWNTHAHVESGVWFAHVCSTFGAVKCSLELCRGPSCRVG